MKSKWLYMFHIMLVVIVAWGLGFSQAKGQEGILPSAPSAGDSNASGAFTYQGVLKENGVPVTGSRSMTFKTYLGSDPTCSGSYTAVQGPQSVAVSNGLFSVKLTAFPGYIQGKAVYLGVEVAGSALSCEELLSVPYAIGLRPGVKIDSSLADSMIAIWNTDTSAAGDGLTAIAYGAGSSGLMGRSVNASGYGVRAVNTSGIALQAEGKIWSDRDSVVVLSPYSMVVRDNASGMDITPLGTGEVRIHSATGAQTIYAALPISAFGTLFGSPMYVKSVEVCYQRTSSLGTQISATQVVKRQGTTYALYVDDPTVRNNTDVECYTASAVTPRLPIDNSSWVQFTMYFDGTAFSYIYIYTVKLTLTESAS